MCCNLPQVVVAGSRVDSRLAGSPVCSADPQASRSIVRTDLLNGGDATTVARYLEQTINNLVLQVGLGWELLGAMMQWELDW